MMQKPKWNLGENLFRDFVTGLILALLILAGLSYLLLGGLGNGVKLVRGFYLVRHNYLSSPDPDNLVDGALSGMLKSLDDPYSYYMNKADYKKLLGAVEGKFVGVGIIIQQDAEGAKIVRVIDGGSAKEAGIIPNEQIVAVEKQTVAGLTLQQIVDRITGPENTSVILGIRNAAGQVRDVTLLRRKFTVPSVRHKMLENGIGYLQIAHFSDETPIETQKAINDLRYNGMRKLILDLRGNPGGSLQAVTKVANLLLPKGELVHIVGRNHKNEHIQLEGTDTPVPLAVLIDHQSASASEILAVAIQDKERGVLIGQTTYGKGTVQGIIPVSDAEGIRITVAEYFSPKGRSINGLGVKPDVELSDEQLYSPEIINVAIAELNK